MTAGPLQPYPPDVRLVVRGVNWLGDAVMSSPALLRLREAYPSAYIALLTPSKLADLWQNHPAVNAVLPVRASESVFSVGRRVRAEKFEAGLVLPNSFRSAAEFWLARIPARIGYAGQARTFLLTRAVPSRPGARCMRKRSAAEVSRLIRAANLVAPSWKRTGTRTSSPHHIHQYLYLASQIGASAEPVAPRLVVHPSEAEELLRRFRVNTSDGHPLFGVNPGAEYGPAKRWPLENFVSAACRFKSGQAAAGSFSEARVIWSWLSALPPKTMPAL